MRTSQHEQPTSTDDSVHAQPSRGLPALAWAGIIGPILFTATFLVQEAFRRNEYDPLAEPVSALAAGPNGWIQNLNFLVFGLLTIGFAVGLHRGLRPSRAGVAGPALVFLSGIGLLLAAGFPLREDAAGVTYDPGGHIVAGMTFFLTSALAPLVLAHRLAGDPRWRGLTRYSVITGLLALAGFVFGGALVLPDDAALHDWAGLHQRVMILAILFPWRVLISLRLLRLCRQS